LKISRKMRKLRVNLSLSARRGGGVRSRNENEGMLWKAPEKKEQDPSGERSAHKGEKRSPWLSILRGEVGYKTGWSLQTKPN